MANINLNQNGKININGNPQFSTVGLLGTLTSKGQTINLNNPLINSSTIVIFGLYEQQIRGAVWLPAGIILNQQNVNFAWDSFDGGNFRIQFTNTTATLSSNYYTGTIYIYQIT